MYIKSTRNVLIWYACVRFSTKNTLDRYIWNTGESENDSNRTSTETKTVGIGFSVDFGAGHV